MSSCNDSVDRFNQLPPEVLINIFSYDMEESTKKNLCAVDKKTNKFMKDYMIKFIKFNATHKVDAKKLNCIQKNGKDFGDYIGVLAVDLTSCSITDLSTLAQIFPQLTYLNLSGTKIKNKNLKKITRFSELSDLDLSNSNLKDKGLIFVAQLPKLDSLNLSGCKQITDKGLLDLPENLTSLQLRDCKQITDEGLGYLPKNLIFLNLGGCQKITNNGLGYLPENLTSLQLLDFTTRVQINNDFEFRMTDVGFRHLAKLTKLSSFSCSSLLTPDLFKHLSENLPKLSSLTLSDVSFDERKIRYLAQLKNLSELTLITCIISKEAITSLLSAFPTGFSLITKNCIDYRNLPEERLQIVPGLDYELRRGRSRDRL